MTDPCAVCGLFHPHEKPFTNLVECVTALRQDRVRCLETIADLELGTCDWGDCDRLAVDTRYHDQEAPNPLPVCVQHSEPYALLEAEHATLMSMVEKAASTLRDFAEDGDDDDPVDAGIRQQAKRTLKAMREIGGLNG